MAGQYLDILLLNLSILENLENLLIKREKLK